MYTFYNCTGITNCSLPCIQPLIPVEHERWEDSSSNCCISSQARPVITSFSTVISGSGKILYWLMIFLKMSRFINKQMKFVFNNEICFLMPFLTNPCKGHKSFNSGRFWFINPYCMVQVLCSLIMVYLLGVLQQKYK